MRHIYFYKFHIVTNMKTTIIIEKETREHLRNVGRKNQTYDDLIRELIRAKYTAGGAD